MQLKYARKQILTEKGPSGVVHQIWQKTTWFSPLGFWVSIQLMVMCASVIWPAVISYYQLIHNTNNCNSLISGYTWIYLVT